MKYNSFVPHFAHSTEPSFIWSQTQDESLKTNCFDHLNELHTFAAYCVTKEEDCWIFLFFFRVTITFVGRSKLSWIRKKIGMMIGINYLPFIVHVYPQRRHEIVPDSAGRSNKVLQIGQKFAFKVSLKFKNPTFRRLVVVIFERRERHFIWREACNFLLFTDCTNESSFKLNYTWFNKNWMYLCSAVSFKWGSGVSSWNICPSFCDFEVYFRSRISVVCEVTSTLYQLSWTRTLLSRRFSWSSKVISSSQPFLINSLFIINTIKLSFLYYKCNFWSSCWLFDSESDSTEFQRVRKEIGTAISMWTLLARLTITWLGQAPIPQNSSKSSPLLFLFIFFTISNCTSCLTLFQFQGKNWTFCCGSNIESQQLRSPSSSDFSSNTSYEMFGTSKKLGRSLQTLFFTRYVVLNVQCPVNEEEFLFWVLFVMLLGYNTIHLSPVQELGESNSAYCIRNQLVISPALFPGEPNLSSTVQFHFDTH